MRPTTLYRFFDAAGDLLYVGITSVGGLRWSQHARSKPWWPEVANAVTEHFDSREEALIAESTAIRSERPKHNRAGAIGGSPGQTWMSAEETNQSARQEAEALGTTPIGVSGIAAWFGVEPNTVSRSWIGQRQSTRDPIRRFPEPTWPGPRPMWATRVVEKWGIATGRLAGPAVPADGDSLYRAA